MKIVTKKIAAVICVSVLSACATQQPLATSSVPDRGEINIYKNDKKEIESIIGNDALRAFKAEYAAASDNGWPIGPVNFLLIIRFLSIKILSGIP